jgi:Pao retrotransposon peptidase
MWDDHINESQYKTWLQILKWFSSMEHFKVTRHIFNAHVPTSTSIRQLWVFSDASKDMVGCVVYFRLSDNTGLTITHNLLLAKSYVVPLKQQRTIPELELDGIDKAVKLAVLSRKYFDISFDETIIATDSACCYSWVNYRCEKPTIYMKNRIGRIEAEKPNIQVVWVRTDPSLFARRVLVDELKPPISQMGNREISFLTHLFI